MGHETCKRPKTSIRLKNKYTIQTNRFIANLSLSYGYMIILVNGWYFFLVLIIDNKITSNNNIYFVQRVFSLLLMCANIQVTNGERKETLHKERCLTL